MAKPNMKRWTDAKLDKEFYFAIAASDANDPNNVAWVNAVKDEMARRIEIARALRKEG